MLRICKNCRKEFEDNHKSSQYPLDFCCYHCYEEWNKFNKMHTIKHGNNNNKIGNYIFNSAFGV